MRENKQRQPSRDGTLEYCTVGVLRILPAERGVEREEKWVEVEQGGG